MKFDFLNSSGETLSGSLEMPSGKPRAYALFAHCFTCTKNIIAPSVVSRTLTKNGIAVLRFDFTGLGHSEGDFSNTNFSSNVDDLLSACKSLGEKFEHPELLIGHSLGGAAVLKAASKLPKVKAVATIGAPSDIEHVKHLFGDKMDQIEQDGKAKVNLAGREFTIKKQFIDDISNTSILDDLKKLKKSLLIMHSPTDNTVSVEHAAKIFSLAKHPKSFVTLDDADHLLMKRSDAQYAGEIIGSWALKYLPQQTETKKNTSIEQGEVVVEGRKGTKFTQDIYTTHHKSVADEPLSYKGNNLGMSPYDYLLSALGACTSMTIKMYADRKNFKIDDIKVILSHKKIHAKDCEDCETQSGKVDVIEKRIFIQGDISDEQRARLHEIAEKCPVNKTLQSEVKIKSS